MASLLSEPLSERLNLQQLAREQGVAPPTTWRWAMRGVRGLRLPTILIGSKRVTTRSTFQLWCEQLTALADGQPQFKTNSASELTSVAIKKADSEAAKLLRL